ncbi:HNH endonuclease (plasmid) [Streptomyces sp. NBC_01233]|nr:HNH endonuclease [Streptomyces sp. NBC_01233]
MPAQTSWTTHPGDPRRQPAHGAVQAATRKVLRTVPSAIACRCAALTRTGATRLLTAGALPISRRAAPRTCCDSPAYRCLGWDHLCTSQPLGHWRDVAVSNRLRFEVLRRDRYTCRYCGGSAPDVTLRVDHVVPVALGGSDTPDNLVAACEPCNSGKSSMTADSEIVKNVSRDALRWAEAMRRAAADMTAQHEVGETFRSTFFESWNSWTHATSGEDGAIALPTDWKNSLDGFREAGLPVEAIPGIVEKAMRKGGVKTENRFRYFCGITWRMIGELQERARAYVSDGEGSRKPLSFTPWIRQLLRHGRPVGRRTMRSRPLISRSQPSPKA